jgi:hypothetical protein
LGDASGPSSGISGSVGAVTAVERQAEKQVKLQIKAAIDASRVESFMSPLSVPQNQERGNVHAGALGCEECASAGRKQ